MALICSSFLAQYRASSSGISESTPDIFRWQKNKCSGGLPRVLKHSLYSNSLTRPWYDCGNNKSGCIRSTEATCKPDVHVWKRRSQVDSIDSRKADGRLHGINGERKLARERIHTHSPFNATHTHTAPWSTYITGKQAPDWDNRCSSVAVFCRKTRRLY